MFGPMELKDPVTAHLVAEASLTNLINGKEVRLGSWEWREEDLPTDHLGEQLPGGQRGGIFAVDHVRVEFPSRGDWFGGTVELTVGVRTYFTLACDLLPVAFAGRLWVPDRQHMYAKFRAWTWTGSGPTPPEGNARLVLAGKWAKELRK